MRRYAFVERPSFDIAANSVIERNVLAFESKLPHSNDYGYAIFAGASGMGKTVGGFELADRIRKFRPNHRVVHAFMLPAQSPFPSQLRPPPNWKPTDGPPDGMPDPFKSPVALGIASWYFLKNSSPEAQHELLALDSSCCHLRVWSKPSGWLSSSMKKHLLFLWSNWMSSKTRCTHH